MEYQVMPAGRFGGGRTRKFSPECFHYLSVTKRKVITESEEGGGVKIKFRKGRE